MAHSVEGITADMLQEMSQWCLREDTLKAANAILVNFHHRLPLSAVWGDGTVSSSDGQRFGLQASSLLGSLYPRYFGYYDRALTVYTHIADQHSVFHTQVIACSVREAIYVLGRAARQRYDPAAQGTFCRPAWLHRSTLWPLSPAWAIALMPRLNVSKQTLYKLDRTKHYGRLDAVITGTVDIGADPGAVGSTGAGRRLAPQPDGPGACRVTALSQQCPVRSPGQGAHRLGPGAQEPLPLTLYP